MGFGAHGKKRHRLDDGGPSESKRAFSGQGSGDDARGSVTSKEPATQFRNPCFPDEVPSVRNVSISGLNSDASSISTIAECHNADALSGCTSRDGNLSQIEWPDDWEQPSVDTECFKSEEIRNWASSFSDLRSELTVSGLSAFASSSPDNHLIREHESSVGFAVSNVRPSRVRGNRPPDYRRFLTSRKERERWESYSLRSRGGASTLHFKVGAFRRNDAVDTISNLQELDEAAAEKQPHSAFAAIPLENIAQESSAEVCMDEQPRTSISVGEDHMIDTRVSLNCQGECSEGRSGGMDLSLLDCPIGPSVEEGAFSGESNDKDEWTSYVHSSGRLSLEERARLGERSPTIDHDFEDYFAALLL